MAIGDDQRALLQAALVPGERLDWASPASAAAELLVPTRWLFPLFWLTVTGWINLLIWFGISNAADNPASTLLLIRGFAGGFLLLGFLLMWILLVGPALAAATTVYAITDRRLIKLRLGHVRQIEMVPLGRISAVNGGLWLGVDTLSYYDGAPHATGRMTLYGARGRDEARRLLGRHVAIA